MKKKIYHLSTCNTCARIIKELGLGEGVDFQDIKTEPITEAQIEEMAGITGSYESLFSRRARKFREMNLGAQDLTEADYKRLILEEYTFLKRPVLLVGEQAFVGNAAKVVEAGHKALESA